MSQSTAEFVEHARLVPPEKVKVVYLGAPLEEFGRRAERRGDRAARAELGAAPGDFAIGTITRLHDSKGNEFLVEAARAGRRRRTRARGSSCSAKGPLREPLEAQARALGLGDRFVFGGFQKDVRATLSAFDLSVFPSLWEGTPLTAFEALAAGKAIVATDADGLLDILERRRDARRSCRGATPPRWPTASSMRWTIPTSARAMAARRAARRPAVRHRDVRAQDGAALHVLHAVSRPTSAAASCSEDLSFLTTGAGL